MRRPVRAVFAVTTVFAGLALAGSAAAAPSVSDSNHVHPGQAFVGSVNGSFSDATIRVICPGPSFPGSKGHPVSGQTMEVLSPPPPVAYPIKVSVGRTGTLGRSIAARFSDDSSVKTTFAHYFVNKAIPTSLLLPCAGTGKVVFRPVPFSPDAKASVVSVTYENIAVTPQPTS